jgi:hypothetical protein
MKRDNVIIGLLVVLCLLMVVLIFKPKNKTIDSILEGSVTNTSIQESSEEIEPESITWSEEAVPETTLEVQEQASSLAAEDVDNVRNEVALNRISFDGIEITEDHAGTKEEPVRYLLRGSEPIRTEDEFRQFLTPEVVGVINKVYSGEMYILAMEALAEFMSNSYKPTSNGTYFLEDTYVSNGKVVAVYYIMNPMPVKYVICILDEYEGVVSVVNYEDEDYENPNAIYEDNTP